MYDVEARRQHAGLSRTRLGCTRALQHDGVDVDSGGRVDVDTVRSHKLMWAHAVLREELDWISGHWHALNT